MVTIRRALDAMLNGEADGDVGASDVRSALEGAGFGEVPADLVGTAVGHYADSAPIEQADALAPLATEASSVPFDPDLDGPLDRADLDHDADPMDDLDAADVVDAAPELGPAEAEESAEADDAEADDGPELGGDIEPDEGFDTAADEFGAGSLDTPISESFAESAAVPDEGLSDALSASLEDNGAPLLDELVDLPGDGGAGDGVPEFDDGDLVDPDDSGDGFDPALDGFDIG